MPKMRHGHGTKKINNKTYTEMEILTSKSLTSIQNLRYELLQWCGNVEDAEKANAFIMGGQKAEQTRLPNTEWKHGDLQKPNQSLPDGVYLVQEDGQVVLFFEDATADIGKVIGVGVKMGAFNLMVALDDEANGDDITLTTKDNGTDEKSDKPYYFGDATDAIAEMDGDVLTEHLRPILNPKIKLKHGWFIPSLGELYRIFINLKAINKALEYVEGEPLKLDWYWTSTEGSATSAWGLYLYDGRTDGWGTKASGAGRVRAVSAFISPNL